MAMAVLNAGIICAVSFGAKLSTQQIAAVTGFAGAILALGGGIVRSQVQPLAKMAPAQAVQALEQAKVDEAKS